jgi:hypothetical protein
VTDEIPTVRLSLKGKSEKDVMPEAEREARLLSAAKKEVWVVFYIRPREPRDPTPRIGTTHFAWVGPEARKKAFLVRVKHEADARRKAEAEAKRAQEEAASKAAADPAAPKRTLGAVSQKKGAAAETGPKAEGADAEEGAADAPKDEKEPAKGRDKEKPSGTDPKKKGSTGRKG